MARKLIVAHRGAPYFFQENTIPGFKKAVELGADYIELDVRQTKDKILAIFHNPKIAGQKISELTFSELNNLAKGYAVPTLEEVLQEVSGKIKLSIEVKELGYEFETIHTALKYLRVEDFEIISFKYKVIEKIKKQYPEVSVKLILGFIKYGWDEIIYFFFNFKKITRTVDGFCLNYNWLNWGLSRLIDKPITIWTVDDADKIEKFFDNEKVLAITSNKPDLALKLRNQNYA